MSNEINKLVNDLVDDRLSRRDFIKRAAALGIGMSSIGAILAACGGAATPAATETAAATTSAAATETAAGTATAAATTAAAATTDLGKGGTVVLSQYAEWAPLDPTIAQGEVTHWAMIPIFEGLWMRDLTIPDLKTAPPVIGVLAKSWEWSPDVLQLTVKLQPNVKFHDGTPWDADAAKFNFDRVINKDFEFYYPQGAAMLGWMYNKIKDVLVVDPATIRINFTKPFADFIDVTCEPCGIGASMMIAPSSVKQWGNEAVGEHPVGTGPFTFVARERGVKTEYQRNEAYWDPKRPARPDRMIFRPDVDPSVRVAALRAGEVDMAYSSLPYDDLAALEQEGFKITSGRVPSFDYRSINMQHPAMQDINVRKALNLLTDREKMCKELFAGWAFPHYQMASPVAASAVPNWEPLKFNPDEGQSLLAQAGYGPDKHLSFILETNSVSAEQDMAQWMQQQWAQYGIDIEITTYEWQTYVTRWGAGMEPNVGMNVMGWGMNTDWWLNHPFRNYNTGHVEDQTISDLLDQADSELDGAKRAKLFEQVNRRDREMVYTIPLVGLKGETVYNADRVHNWFHVPEWSRDLRMVWVTS
jgi:peptide/nickel transport system substrate-binding protein